MKQKLLIENKKVSIQGILNLNEQVKAESKLVSELLGEYLKVECGVS